MAIGNTSRWRVEHVLHLLYRQLNIVVSSFGCEETFCFVAVTFAFAILLVCVLYCDFLVGEELAVHIRDCFVGGFKVGE